MVVKVLNGCGLNNAYWVFAAGLTNDHRHRLHPGQPAGDGVRSDPGDVRVSHVLHVAGTTRFRKTNGPESGAVSFFGLRSTRAAFPNRIPLA